MKKVQRNDRVRSCEICVLRITVYSETLTVNPTTPGGSVVNYVILVRATRLASNKQESLQD